MSTCGGSIKSKVQLTNKLSIPGKLCIGKVGSAVTIWLAQHRLPGKFKNTLYGLLLHLKNAYYNSIMSYNLYPAPATSPRQAAAQRARARDSQQRLETCPEAILKECCSRRAAHSSVPASTSGAHAHAHTHTHTHTHTG